jgi:hypothetical protein
VITFGPEKTDDNNGMITLIQQYVKMAKWALEAFKKLITLSK